MVIMQTHNMCQMVHIEHWVRLQVESAVCGDLHFDEAERMSVNDRDLLGEIDSVINSTTTFDPRLPNSHEVSKTRLHGTALNRSVTIKGL